MGEKIGYLRLSSNIDGKNYINLLNKYGCEEIYREKDEGEQLAKAIRRLEDGDEFVVVHLKQIAKTYRKLLIQLRRILKKKIKLHSLREGTITNSKHVRDVLKVLDLADDLFVAQRLQAGLRNRLLQEGKHAGGRPANIDKWEETMMLRKKGMTCQEIANRFGVSLNTVYSWNCKYYQYQLNLLK